MPSVRLRLGILLWLLSWIPYGWILGITGPWLTLVWTIEIALGLAGLAIAGTEFARAAKECGWKRTPAVAWHAIVHGQDIDPIWADTPEPRAESG